MIFTAKLPVKNKNMDSCKLLFNGDYNLLQKNKKATREFAWNIHRI